MSSQFGLMRERRFLPFFLTQFLGAFNDNAYKNALIILVGFNASDWGGMSTGMLSNIAAGLFILPFFLFSATAGQLADKYEKSRLIRLTKLLEIVVSIIAVMGFYVHSLSLLLIALFLLGTQATLFGPVKYAILPQHLKLEELIGGNALVEGGTFIAILLGTLLGGILASYGAAGVFWICVMITTVAVAGYLTSWGIPLAPAAAPELKINWNPVSQTWETLKITREFPAVFLSIIGISWFWFYGAIFLSQFPEYTRNVLQGNEHVVTLLLTAFSIGIGTGSLLCERLSGKQIEIGLVPLGSIGMTIFSIDLALEHPVLPAQGVWGAADFLGTWGNLHILLDLVLIGLFGGLYIVPLYALMQSRSPVAVRSRMIASNNIVNSIFMVLAAVLAVGLLQAGLTIPQIFLLTALGNVVAGVIIYRKVPEFLLRFCAWLLVSSIYRLKKTGLAHLPKQGGALFVCNHVSAADLAIVATLNSRPIRFALPAQIHAVPGLRWILRDAGTLPLPSESLEGEPAAERYYRRIAAALRAGEWVCLFPEAHRTPDGTLQPFAPYLSALLAHCPKDAPVIPLHLSGLWGSLFSRKGSVADKVRAPRPFRREVGLDVGAPLTGERTVPRIEQAMRDQATIPR